VPEKLVQGAPGLRSYWVAQRLLVAMAVALVLLPPIGWGMSQLPPGDEASRALLWLFLFVMLAFILLPLAAYAGYAHLEYAAYGYRLGKHVVSIRRGVFFRYTRHIPYEIIMSVTVTSTPLLRRFGISTITIHAPYGSVSGVFLPSELMGIRDADRLYEDVMNRVEDARSRRPVPIQFSS
jgi:membrane protein YdbS with pleckstrin-like domain